MARPRTVKPEYFRDKVIGGLGSQVGTVFQALWCTADDGGVAPADPDLLKGEMLVRWPEYTLAILTDCLQQLADHKRIRLYAVDGALFAEIPTLSEHNPGRGRFRHPRGGQPVKDVKAFVAGQLGLPGYELVLMGTDRPASASPITNTLVPVPLPLPQPAPHAAAPGPSDVPSSANGVPSLSYTQRCVIALNRAIEVRVGASRAMPIPASTQEGLVDWECDGIPVAIVERVIAERVRAYRATDRSPYPRSLKYFDGAVRDAWEREGQALTVPRTPLPRVVA